MNAPVAPVAPTRHATSVDPDPPRAAGSSHRDLLGQIDFHRDAMLRFARRRIRDSDLAEDAVQDAMASAVAGLAGFQGGSALRTWLIGILGHKIQDIFRREGRYVRMNGEAADFGEGAMALFGEARDSSDPLALVARRRLGQALRGEIENLPPSMREVFRMQVLEGAPTAEICRRLSISEANCWVRLHRARKRLASRMTPHFA